MGVPNTYRVLCTAGTREGELAGMQFPSWTLGKHCIAQFRRRKEQIIENPRLEDTRRARPLHQIRNVFLQLAVDTQHLRHGHRMPTANESVAQLSHHAFLRTTVDVAIGAVEITD